MYPQTKGSIFLLSYMQHSIWFSGKHKDVLQFLFGMFFKQWCFKSKLPVTGWQKWHWKGNLKAKWWIRHSVSTTNTVIFYQLGNNQVKCLKLLKQLDWHHDASVNLQKVEKRCDFFDSEKLECVLNKIRRCDLKRKVCIHPYTA